MLEYEIAVKNGDIQAGAPKRCSFLLYSRVFSFLGEMTYSNARETSLLTRLRIPICFSSNLLVNATYSSIASCRIVSSLVTCSFEYINSLIDTFKAVSTFFKVSIEKSEYHITGSAYVSFGCWQIFYIR